ncbi:hypothetical protein [Puerhibacterium puerhi]|uniref:hypothetical protein n=1 Tax=Puerhibacterium puerhi TaxID=2692623 RepID=UPI001915B8A9|nr:hypothetical protein [Puerhibacterium puerhi]
MPKVSLTSLLDNAAAQPAPAPAPTPTPEPPRAAVPAPEAAPAAELPQPSATRKASTRPARRAQAEPARRSEPAGGPKYLQLERKETRIRADQWEGLTATARRLNKERNREGERITENTLIRVAADLLLSRADELSGVTEDDLRKSLGL